MPDDRSATDPTATPDRDGPGVDASSAAGAAGGDETANDAYRAAADAYRRTAAGAQADADAAGTDAAAGSSAAGTDAAGSGAAGGTDVPPGTDAAGGTTAPSDSDAPNDGSGDASALDMEAVAAADPRSKAELLTELVTAEHKRDEYLDDLRRSHAEFENYRRRMTRDGAAQRTAGRAEVFESVLDVLDDLDRTLAAAEGSADADLAKGVSLVAEKLAHALQHVGLERVDAAGVPFDPNVHEAVSQVPSEDGADEPMVAQVLRPGYRAGDRVLRATMVVVAQ